jgi:hypothetical protein
MKYAKLKLKAKPAKSAKAKPKAAPLPFHNIITPVMADKHAVRLKARMDRIAAEQAANYQTEYNSIAGRAYQGGANAQQASAAARRHFAGIHGEQHLPK